MNLRFKGAQPTLYKGNNTVRYKEIIKFDKEEAEYRLKNHPGMWEKVVEQKDEPKEEKEPKESKKDTIKK